jgi:hypothetical protein
MSYGQIEENPLASPQLSQTNLKADENGQSVIPVDH